MSEALDLEHGVFTIPAVVRRHRYLLNDGHTIDVDSPYDANSTDRGAVLAEAHRRWGGKKDDWKIQGIARLAESAGA